MKAAVGGLAIGGMVDIIMRNPAFLKSLTGMLGSVPAHVEEPEPKIYSQSEVDLMISKAVRKYYGDVRIDD